jgi:hypothetical protein
MSSLLSQIFSCWSTPLAQALSDDPPVPQRNTVASKVPSSEPVYPAQSFTPPQPPSPTHLPSPPTTSAPKSIVSTTQSTPRPRDGDTCITSKALDQSQTHQKSAPPQQQQALAPKDWDDWGSDDEEDTTTTTNTTTVGSPAGVDSVAITAEQDVVTTTAAIIDSLPSYGNLAPVTSLPTFSAPKSIESEQHNNNDDGFANAVGVLGDPDDIAQPDGSDVDDDVTRALRPKTTSKLQLVEPEPEPEIDYFADMAPTVVPAKRLVVDTAPKQSTPKASSTIAVDTELPASRSQNLSLGSDIMVCSPSVMPLQ